MDGNTGRRCGRVGLAAAFFLSGVVAVSPRLGAQAKAIATIDTNLKATAEIYECKRKQGVLTVKVRFVAKANASASISLPYKDTYVVDVASGKKYEVLRDSDKKPIASLNQFYRDDAYLDLKAGESGSLWWKFPAPPAETKKVSFFMPSSDPAEDVPITDAP